MASLGKILPFLTLGVAGGAAYKALRPKSTGGGADFGSLLDSAPDTQADAIAANTASVAAAALARRKLIGKGRAGTLLTGPQGVTTKAPTAQKTLLGE